MDGEVEFIPIPIPGKRYEEQIKNLIDAVLQIDEVLFAGEGEPVCPKKEEAA